MRVLVVTPWFPGDPQDPSGSFVLHSVTALREAGVAVSVLVVRPWTPRILAAFHPDWRRPRVRTGLFDTALNVEVAHHLSIPRNYWNELAGPLFRAGTRRAIVRRARAFRPDVLHVHTEGVGHAIRPIAAGLRLPFVVTVHGINPAPRLLDTPWKRRRMHDALNAAARVVLVGEPLRATYAELAGRDDRFRVVPNGFALPEAPQGGAPDAHDGTLRWISVANLHEGKGIDLVLRALGRLAHEGMVDWTYDVVGEGAERVRLEALTAELGLRGKVAFHGRLPHNVTLRRVACADAFVLPSYREAFGIAYVEAMALGLLAIGVAGQGPSAFIEDGVTGLLVRPNDVDALCTAMRSAMEERPAMRAIAAAGQRHVCAEYTWARHAEKLAAVLAEAVHGC